MEVKLTEKLFGVADGDIYPRWFLPGEVVSGDLAQSALEEGKAQKKRQAPEPDHQKQSSVSQRGQVSRKRTARKSKT